MVVNDLDAPEPEREVVEVEPVELGQVREAVPAAPLEDPTASSLPCSSLHWLAPRNPGFVPDSRSPTVRLPECCMACVVPWVAPRHLASLVPVLNLRGVASQLTSPPLRCGSPRSPRLAPPRVRLAALVPYPDTASLFRREAKTGSRTPALPSSTSRAEASTSRVGASTVELPESPKTFGAALGGVTGAVFPRSA